jgi:hypothetical protein
MPIGGGIVPATGSTQYTELTYVTRRAFIPKLVVQLYNSTPLMAALIANTSASLRRCFFCNRSSSGRSVRERTMV